MCGENCPLKSLTPPKRCLLCILIITTYTLRRREEAHAEWFMAAVLLLALASGASAQQPSYVIPRLDLVNPQVRTVVTSSASGFDYEYVVSNKAAAQQTVIMFAVEAFTVPP